MIRHHSRLITLFVIFLMFLTACNQPFFSKPTSTSTATPTKAETATPTATSTSTLTNTPTITQTRTPTQTSTITFTPTETSIPEPTSLAGIISLSHGTLKPFPTTIELREKDSFKLLGKGNTDSSGLYKIANLQPGIYDIWILVTSQSAMIPGCTDVAPPNNTWKMGIKFGADQAMTMETAYLSKLLLFTSLLQSPDLKAQGYYAVLTDYQIIEWKKNIVDVTLQCK
jgi:hypothetical protein